MNFLLFSQLCVLTLIRCPFHPVLPQWHIKGLGHSAKIAGGVLHLNIRSCAFDLRLTTLSRNSVGTYQGNERTRNSSGNARPQSFQLAESLWTNPGLWNRNFARKLISTSKKTKQNKQQQQQQKPQAGNALSNLPP